MRKIVVANVSSLVNEEDTNLTKKMVAFELTEINEFLSDGWIIEKYDIVQNGQERNFSIIYQLVR